MKKDASKKLVDSLPISTSEIKLTIISFLYFFFVISSYYMLKPVRDSLALEFGSKNINLLNILSMFCLVGVNALYSVIVGKYKRDIFIPYITKFFIACIVGFWLVFSFVIPIKPPATTSASIKNEQIKQTEQAETQSVQNNQPTTQKESINEKNLLTKLGLTKIVFYGGFYLWVNVFSLIAVCMFWSFMNDVFTVEQGKRLYALIGYGGLIGGVVGSTITKHIVRGIGTENILLVSIVLLYPSIYCMKYIHHQYRPEGIAENVNTPAQPAHPPSPLDGFASVCKNFILILMAFEMFFYTCSTTFFSQQMNHLVETQISMGTFNTVADARTAFIADLYGWVNIMSLVAQFVVTQLVMLLANPIYGLLLLNIIQVVGTGLLLMLPSMGLATMSLTVLSWTFIFRRALDYSTARILRESIYIPLDRSAKYQGKGFIDTVVFRFGDGLSSIMLFGGMTFFGYGTWIDYSILVVMAMQFYVIIRAAKLYAQMANNAKNAIEPVTAV